MHCFECAAAMPDNMIYCLNCGAKLDGEAETAVRETIPAPRIVIMPPIPSRTEIATSYVKESRPLRYIVGGVVLVAVIAGLAFLAYLFYFQVPDATFGLGPNNNSVASAAPTPTPEIIIITATPKLTRTSKPRLAPTPISIDEVQGEIMDDEMRQRNANANRTVVLPPPAITEFNRQGERLRAICKNGEPSYWQFDKFLTCKMNGGVARWNRQHPKN